MLTKEQYALICFVVLMDNYGTKDFRYMEEKLTMLEDGLLAFAWLDFKNMEKVMKYLVQWKEEIPDEWAREYELQMTAKDQLGIDF